MRHSRFGGLILLSLLLTGCQALGLGIINAASPDTASLKNVRFASGARGQMNLYAPKQAVTAAPLIVFWYGGAWQRGSKDDYRFVGAALAARGAVAVVPDYRLYPEVRFPEFLRDAAAAVARAQQAAPQHGADPRRTVLGGHSAGAYIAAMLALQPQYLRDAGVDPASIAGFFGLSGPYALVPDTQILHAIFTATATPAQFQVVRQVQAGPPPALLVHGTADAVVHASHTESLAAALRDQGGEVTVRLVPDRKHVDTVIALSRPAAFRIPGLPGEISAFAAGLPARLPAR